ncbi:MAG: aminoglycoside phosphotransferase family protein [Candidatus Thorarchaeota archaeon]
MMEFNIKQVHGHTISELEALLEDSSDSFDDIVILNPKSTGGWSNINIRGSCSDIEFILKLPWSTEKYQVNPYRQLYKTGLHYARLNVASHPIEFGRLSDLSETPFFLIEFIKGTTSSTILDASPQELLSLKESLRIMRSEVPKGIPKYETPADYLASNHNKVVEHPWLQQATTQTRQLIEEFMKLFQKVESMMAILGYWSGDVMHGDLWPPNILFRQSQEALLLDFDACAIGDSRYDLSYLMEGERIVNIPKLIPDEDLIFINKLRPLALSYMIEWSIERLLSMESGIVESNLNTLKLRKTLLSYIESNLSRLKVHLPK